VTVASGANFPDALAAGPVAAASGGPLLLVPQGGALPTTVSTELTRLNPSSVNIAGGTTAVNSLVESELLGFGAGTVFRLAGQDRYETAAALAGISNGGLGKTVFIATGASFPDALSGSAAAGRLGHAARGRSGPGLPATWSHRTEVDAPGAVGVLVVPGRRWRSPGRTHHGAHAHRLLTPGYLAGRVRLSDCIGKGTDEHHRFRSQQNYRAAHRVGPPSVRQGCRGPAVYRRGAAMAQEFDTRRTTRDIDAVLHPPTTVAEEAASMATELGLPPGWLSAAASPFIPLPDEDPVSLDVEGLQVAISSPANLLAMKMAAGRPQDLTDLVVLFRHLKIRNPEQAVDIAERMYGDDLVVLNEPRESLLLLAESVLARVHASKSR
jgi:hypothetical protein